MSWEPVPVINLLLLNPQSVLLWPLCDGPGIVSFASWHHVNKPCRQRGLEGHCRSEGFSLPTVGAFPSAYWAQSLATPPAPCSCSTWQSAGCGSQQLSWAPPRWLCSGMLLLGPLPWMAQGGDHCGSSTKSLGMVAISHISYSYIL